MIERDAAAETSVPVGMFTETLARLYMRQGHVDQALRIYRHLAAQEPSDVALKEQIHALEHQLASVPEMETETGVQVLPTPADWCAQQEAEVYAPLPGVQVLWQVEQTRHVITHLERWLRVLRQRMS